LIVLLSSFPVYWTFTIARRPTRRSSTPPPFLPGGTSWPTPGGCSIPSTREGARQLVLVAGSITASTLLFCSVAGFAFAKLRFRGRDALLLVVIATMMCPCSWGVIPLYIESRRSAGRSTSSPSLSRRAV